MKDYRILIAGAGGYLGSKMVEYFLSNGFKVTALDRYYFGDVFADLHNPDLTIIREDIRSVSVDMLKNHFAVINLASISNDPAAELDQAITISINFDGAVGLAKKAKKAGCQRYVFASSCSVYGQGDGELTELSPLAPVSAYAKSKIMAEKSILALKDNKYSPTILRFATLYGLSKRRMRFDLMINIMTLHALKKNRIFIMGGGKQWRPLLHVNDCINACELMLTSESSKVAGEIFNVGSNEQNYQVSQVAYAFKNYFPQLSIEETPEDPDKRSYKVNFDKIRRTLHYKTKNTIGDGILEIKDALERGVITDELRTSTVNYYKYLMDADKILAAVKIKNSLF